MAHPCIGRCGDITYVDLSNKMYMLAIDSSIPRFETKFPDWVHTHFMPKDLFPDASQAIKYLDGLVEQMVTTYQANGILAVTYKDNIAEPETKEDSSSKRSAIVAIDRNWNVMASWELKHNDTVELGAWQTIPQREYLYIGIASRIDSSLKEIVLLYNHRLRTSARY